MSFPLLRKELRDLIAFLALELVFFGFSLAEILLDQTDMHSLWGQFSSLNSSDMELRFLIAFGVGTGLLVREQDNGTLAFLDGLPVTRRRLFASKVFVATTILMVWPTLDNLLATTLHLMGRTSLNHALHADLLVISWASNLGVTLAGLAAGMLIGYLRSLAWAALATISIALHLLVRQLPRADVFDPTEVARQRMTGAHWRLPIEGLVVQAVLIATLFGLAYLVFSGASGRGISRLSEAMKRPLLSALGVVLTVGLVFGALAVMEKKSDPPKVAAKKDVTIAGADFAAG